MKGEEAWQVFRTREEDTIIRRSLGGASVARVIGLPRDYTHGFAEGYEQNGNRTLAALGDTPSPEQSTRAER